MEDEQVMQEVREGAVGRLEVLFDRHHPGILRYFNYLTSNRTLSDDLAQEVFFRLLKYRHTWQAGARPRRAAIEGTTMFGLRSARPKAPGAAGSCGSSPSRRGAV